MSNQELAEKLHKPIIRKLDKSNVHSSFTDNICVVSADFANMSLESEFNKRIWFFLCVVEFFSKYAWVITLEDKEGITITNAFTNILSESNRKPKKRWVDKKSEFYNRSIKSWLQENGIETYSTYNEEISVAAERFIKTLRVNISIKNVYIDKSDSIVKNTTIHITIKMKPADVKSSKYIDFNKENNKEYNKFGVGDYVTISKCQIIFAKGYTPN